MAGSIRYPEGPKTRTNVDGQTLGHGDNREGLVYDPFPLERVVWGGRRQSPEKSIIRLHWEDENPSEWFWPGSIARSTVST